MLHVYVKTEVSGDVMNCDWGQKASSPAPVPQTVLLSRTSDEQPSKSKCELL